MSISVVLGSRIGSVNLLTAVTCHVTGSQVYSGEPALRSEGERNLRQ